MAPQKDAASSRKQESDECPYCGSLQIYRNGHRKNKRLYLCRQCARQWREGGGVGGRSFPVVQIGKAIHNVFTGLSYRQSAKAVKDEFQIHDADISPQTVSNWVNKYTYFAICLTRKLEVPSGGKYWRFEDLVLTIRPTNKSPEARYRKWLLLLDDRFGYVFYVHAGRYKGRSWAKGESPEGLTSAEPKVGDVEVVSRFLKPGPASSARLSEKERSEVTTLTDSYSVKTVSKDRLPFPPGSTVAKLFGEYGTFQSRFKRTLDNTKLRRYLAGWVITNNFFTPRAYLGGRTPAQAAGIEAPISSWADIVMLETCVIGGAKVDRGGGGLLTNGCRSSGEMSR